MQCRLDVTDKKRGNEDNEKHVPDFYCCSRNCRTNGRVPKKSSFMVRMAALEKSSCACTDKTCAEKAINDFLEIGAVSKKEDARFAPEETRKPSRCTITILAAS